jgi:hypothetical protein
MRIDPVDRRVPDMTGDEIVSWMVHYHGLPESSRATVASNLNKQMHWHRLRRWLDKWPVWAALAELLFRRKCNRTQP